MNNSQVFATQMIQIIEQIFFIEKNNIFSYENNLKLYPSEIHFILLINNKPTYNATEIANILRITKRAISQTISRLVKK